MKKSSKSKDEQQAALVLSATAWGDIEKMQALLAQGVDPNSQYEDETALTAAAGPAASIEKVEALLKAGADVNMKNSQGRTALDVAVYSDCINTVKTLIAAGADVTAERSHSLLCGPARWRRTEVVHVLLAAGVNPRPNIRHILRLATGYGDTEMVRAILIANKRKVDKRALVDPLINAASRGNLEMVKLLLEAGADPALDPKIGCNALEEASLKGHHKIVQALLVAGAPPDTKKAALILAAMYGHEGTIRVLIEHGANPSIVNKRTETALMNACEAGKTESARVLLEHKADPNQASRSGTTALMFAAKNGFNDIVRLLLEYGANSQLRDQNTDKKGGYSAEDLAKGKTKAILVAHRERQVLRKVSGVKDTDVPVRKRRIM